MICKTCGAEISNTSNFCSKCGSSFEFEGKKQEMFAKIKSNKKIIIIAVVILCAVIITSLVSYFNSVSYLEKRLTGNTWYSEPVEWDSEYDERKKAYTFEFRSNGECTPEIFKYGHGKWLYDWEGIRYEWELLEDKTLVLDREYYEYGEDWYFENGKLVIEHFGKTLVCHKHDEFGYSYTKTD